MKVRAFADNTRPEMSPAFRFVNTFYCCSGEKVTLSQQSLRPMMCHVVELAIEGGLEFDEDDFTRPYSTQYGAGIPMLYGSYSENGGSGERFYSLAIRCNNISACRAFEKWKERRPFMVDGKRLYRGASVTIDGETWIVTSFKDKEELIVLCHFKETQNVYYGRNDTRIVGKGKPDGILRLSHKELKTKLTNTAEVALATG